MMEPRERAHRIGLALKINFVHCAPRASFSGIMFMPLRVMNPASSSTLDMGVLVGSNGPIHVSPLISKPICPARRWMSSRKSCAADDVLHVVRDQFFIANSVLHGAYGAALVECPRGDLAWHPRMDRFRGNDTVVAAGSSLGSLVRIEFGSESRRHRRDEGQRLRIASTCSFIHRKPRPRLHRL